MAQTFTIDSIEGNSYIGVPVFSRFGQMQNYNYIVMSPQKKLKETDKGDNDLLDAENAKYRLVQDKTQTNYATAPAEPKENQSQSLTQPKSSRPGNY